MTHEQWASALAPVAAAIGAALVLLIGTVATGLNDRLKAYLAAKAGAEVSRTITDAAARVQNAMQNEAGRMILEVGAGQLDVTDLSAVRARAEQGAAAVQAKLPDAVELLKPVEGAIAAAIVGKLGALAATAAGPAPVVGQGA